MLDHTEELKGISYIYGNTPYNCFELSTLSIQIGMVPLLLQSNHLTEANRDDINTILTQYDPYICKAANIAPLQAVYDVLKPHLYLGHEFAPRLQKKGIAIVNSDAASGMLGFEIIPYLLSQLKKATAQSLLYRKELEL